MLRMKMKRSMNFAGLSFDMAIRKYLESFRLPGEAQKINRIMESFGKHYHAASPHLFRNADAVYVLAYSVILLNTDQHNLQVRPEIPTVRSPRYFHLIRVMWCMLT